MTKQRDMEKERYGLDSRIAGKEVTAYLAELVEKNDAQQIEIERGKLSVAIVKQMNNRSRIMLDAAKFELKESEAKIAELGERGFDGEADYGRVKEKKEGIKSLAQLLRRK